jgi:hypothetical protein
VFEAVEFASGRFCAAGSINPWAARRLLPSSWWLIAFSATITMPVCRGVRERGSGRLALRPSQLRRQSAAKASEPTLVDSLRSA